jgi:type I restriction enzyme, S subunit
MDAQQFVAEFGHIAHAPGGLANLRRMIYQLAVTGSLTPRGESAEDAGLLLARIGEERQRLIRAKKYKRMLELESEPVRSPPGIVLPTTWRWTRLLDIGEINPRNDAPDEQLAAFVPMSGVPQLHRAAIVAETKRWGDIKKGYTHFANGDVVLAKITPCFENGKAAAVEGLPGDAGIGAGTTELQVFRPIHAGVLPEYVYLFIRSPLFTVKGERSMTGTAGQKRVPTDYFATRALPLPPTEEQSRIVAKVDELMNLCDRLEQQKQTRCELQSALRHSTLRALSGSRSPHELNASWQRLQDNLGHLLSEPSDVRPLRSLILELAVRGLLTSRSESDTPAEEQLLEIRRHAAELTAQDAGRRRRQAMYPPVDEEELDLRLPAGWKYARLGELVRVLNGRAYSKSELLDRGTPVLRVGNLFTSRDWYYSNLELEADKYCQSGDLLYAWSASFGPFIWNGPKVIFHYHIWKLNLFSEDHLSKDFLFLVLQERTEAIKSSGHGISMAHMTKERMEQLPVAVPPIDEQHRIVRRVADLMLVCDELEAQLKRGMTLSRRLAHEAVASLTGMSVERVEDSAMKAPQTELVALLRLGSPPDVQDRAPLATILVRHQGEMAARDLWQRFGGEIDAFYAQLKTEVAHGWIAEPEPAQVREKPTADAAKA